MGLRDLCGARRKARATKPTKLKTATRRTSTATSLPIGNPEPDEAKPDKVTKCCKSGRPNMRQAFPKAWCKANRIYVQRRRVGANPPFPDRSSVKGGFHPPYTSDSPRLVNASPYIRAYALNPYALHTGNIRALCPDRTKLPQRSQSLGHPDRLPFPPVQKLHPLAARKPCQPVQFSLQLRSPTLGQLHPGLWPEGLDP